VFEVLQAFVKRDFALQQVENLQCSEWELQYSKRRKELEGVAAKYHHTKSEGFIFL
jgi:hypothetical protein